MLHIGIIAGEASGDYLGAKLIHSLRTLHKDISVEGIGGPEMENEGCRNLYPMERLSVMGLFEVMGRFRELYRIRRKIINHFLENPPDIFIGIDAPDFTLKVESVLKKQGIKTVHYVSPQVWAWREYRIKKIARAVNRMLVLLPFEEDYYRKHNIPATYVGHHAADEIEFETDPNIARQSLALPEDKKIIAIMPGSRNMEMQRLSEVFLATANWCYQRRQDIHFVTNLVNEQAKLQFEELANSHDYAALPLSIFSGKSHEVLQAVDVALLASGTITLETMLYKKPMVVAYKINPLTYYLIKPLVKIKYGSLPNILAGGNIVPECIQGDCRVEKMGPLLLGYLDNDEKVVALKNRFLEIHKQLKQNASEKAAASVLELAQAG